MAAARSSAPNGKRDSDTREFALKRTAQFPGAPRRPTGNPLKDGVGPASWAERADEPDITMEGENRIVPLRVATDFHVVERDPDPRGMQVIGIDRQVAGTVSDVWVDRSEQLIRYFRSRHRRRGHPAADQLREIHVGAGRRPRD